MVAPARQVFWRFKADHSVSAGPELSEDHVLLRDDGHVLYVLDPTGALLTKIRPAGIVTTAVRERRGRIYFGTEEGRIQALDSGAPGGSRPAWEYEAPGPVTAGPVFAGDRVLFATASGRVMALDAAGGVVWEFAAEAPIAADPVVADGRVYFGSEDKSFYCLSASTGKKRWSRRLQGVPLHPAHVHGSRVAVAASNSVVYFLSRRGGSILSWELVPSRVVHEPAAAGTVLIISSASPRLSALDLKSGKRLGEHLTSGLLSAGALWVSPLVVAVEEDENTGRQKLVFLGPPRASSTGREAHRK
ncbi:MAG: PQQ-binding-like beta-propeller repeat protein [Candidatus Aminicenantes bacterium]